MAHKLEDHDGELKWDVRLTYEVRVVVFAEDETVACDVAAELVDWTNLEMIDWEASPSSDRRPAWNE